MLRTILLIAVSIVILSCGKKSGGVAYEPNATNVYEYSFEGLELYSFNREFDEHVLKYRADKITSDNYIHHYFNQGVYMQTSNDFQILLNTTLRGSYGDIRYNLNSSGGVDATYNDESIFELKINAKESYKAEKLDEYNFAMELEGTQYQVTKRYAQNLYILKDLPSTEYYENIDAFIAKHRSAPFIGSSYQGLIFSHSNKLMELVDGKYVNAGAYEIKTLNEEQVLFIYPDNQVSYPAHGCYVLDFNHVWLSECYEANQEVNLTLYDLPIYQRVETHLQAHLVDVDVEF
jgi:hypothetical protein